MAVNVGSLTYHSSDQPPAVRFPDIVWAHILALRPRDRDQSSPTAALVRQAYGRAFWQRRQECDLCDRRSMFRTFWDDIGLAEAGCHNPRCDTDKCCIS